MLLVDGFQTKENTVIAIGLESAKCDFWPQPSFLAWDETTALGLPSLHHDSRTSASAVFQHMRTLSCYQSKPFTHAHQENQAPIAANPSRSLNRAVHTCNRFACKRFCNHVGSTRNAGIPRSHLTAANHLRDFRCESDNAFAKIHCTSVWGAWYLPHVPAIPHLNPGLSNGVSSACPYLQHPRQTPRYQPSSSRP
jgi:hypothetical protein